MSFANSNNQLEEIINEIYMLEAQIKKCIEDNNVKEANGLKNTIGEKTKQAKKIAIARKISYDEIKANLYGQLDKIGYETALITLQTTLNNNKNHFLFKEATSLIVAIETYQRKENHYGLYKDVLKEANDIILLSDQPNFSLDHYDRKVKNFGKLTDKVQGGRLIGISALMFFMGATLIACSIYLGLLGCGSTGGLSFLAVTPLISSGFGFWQSSFSLFKRQGISQRVDKIVQVAQNYSCEINKAKHSSQPVNELTPVGYWR